MRQQAVGDLLLVAQGRLVVLDARRADRPVLGELPLAIDIAGTTVPAHPYDIAIVDGRGAVLLRADDTQPAELRVLEVQRRYRLFLPNAPVANR